MLEVDEILVEIHTDHLVMLMKTVMTCPPKRKCPNSPVENICFAITRSGTPGI